MPVPSAGIVSVEERGYARADDRPAPREHG